MGQKTNPNILRLGISKQWNIKTIEKKNQEIAFYSFKSLEIKQFIEKFFKDHGLIVVKCKVYYSDSGLLHIFLLYSTSPDFSFFVTSPSKTSSNLNFNNSTKNYKLFTNSNFLKSKILSTLLNSLHAFTLNKANIVLTINQIIKELSNFKKIELLKKNLIELRKFEDNKFYQRGLQAVFLTGQETNSASFLAKFIAYELSKEKKHNLFVRFLKKALVIAKNDLSHAIKIKISGRFNRARRAKHKFIHVGRDIPILTIKNNINYSVKTAFTRNGTFGIKVWIYTPA